MGGTDFRALKSVLSPRGTAGAAARRGNLPNRSDYPVGAMWKMRSAFS